ncbi:TIGR03619 family F420-dependent LLM class oxidoreductase, partial [Streptomyces sp. NPDC004285]
RRATGWVGAVLPPGAAEGLWDVARRAADEAGRDPDALRRQIRFNPAPGATADAIAGVLSGVRDTGADGCFVDLQQSVGSPDEALELGGGVLDLLRG